MELKQLIIETNAYTNGFDKRRRTPPTNWYRERGWIRTKFWAARIQAQGPRFNGTAGQPRVPTLYQEIQYDKWLATQPPELQLLIKLKGGWEWAWDKYDKCMAGDFATA